MGVVCLGNCWPAAPGWEEFWLVRFCKTGWVEDCSVFTMVTVPPEVGVEVDKCWIEDWLDWRGWADGCKGIPSLFWVCKGWISEFGGSSLSWETWFWVGTATGLTPEDVKTFAVSKIFLACSVFE